MTPGPEQHGKNNAAENTHCHAIPVSSEVLLLSERDYVRLVEIINDPTPPTPALRRAMRKYLRRRARYPERDL